MYIFNWKQMYIDVQANENDIQTEKKFIKLKKSCYQPEMEVRARKTISTILTISLELWIRYSGLTFTCK